MASSDHRLTIGYTYYEDPDLLQEQIELWKLYPSLVEIIVVDDGSSVFPAENFLKDLKILPTLKLFKVNENLGFNSHGCRNLIATVASSDYILFLDLDCHLNPNDVGYLRTVSYNKNSLYKLASFSKKTGSFNEEGHVNVFIVNKEKYWEAGGYDESFTGYHYGDREFMNRLFPLVDIRSLHPLSCTIVRGKRTVIIDENITKTDYDNYANIMIAPIKKLKYAEMQGTVKTKLNFSYTQVL